MPTDEILGDRGASLREMMLDEIFLTRGGVCITMYYMKRSMLTIRLDEELEALLSKASLRTGKNKSEIAREALRRQIRLETFEELRRRTMPFAEARGYLTDEDTFSKIP
jgi:predicted transcriptional regulator